MKILITGGQGNLGSALVDVFTKAGHEPLAVDRDILDITDSAAVEKFLAEHPVDAIINAAAFNNVDGAEQPEIYEVALRINATGPENLARASSAREIPFVHYSTDYVFAGDNPEGFKEDDEPKPISKYGETKLAGERAVLAQPGRMFVVRMSKLFGPAGSSPDAKPSFVSIMLKAAKEKPELAIIDEEVGSPTYTIDAAEATRDLLSGAYTPGIYHIVNEGHGVTWYGFAEEFFKIAGVETPRKPITSVAFPRPAKRPMFAPLVNTKFPKLRSREDALKHFLAGF